MKLEIAKKLLTLGAVKFSPTNPFTYASGLKGPIYCDNRLILSHVEFRETVILKFLEIIKEQSLKFDLVGGIATAGIPHAAFVADRLKAPMVYVRPKAKEHGRKNQVEGDYQSGQSVLLFEDLVNQGSSLVDAMAGLTTSELQCQSCLCVVDYQMQSAQIKIRELGLNLYSLTDFASLISGAHELNLIDKNGIELLEEWHTDPKTWSARFSS